MSKRNRYIEDEDLKETRRFLRSNQTRAEYVLWQELRGEKLGYRFRRQVSVGRFIVDFYCHELKLIIEVDGWVHDERKDYDKWREQMLENQGYNVIRFSNDDVLFERERVLHQVKQQCRVLAETAR